MLDHLPAFATTFRVGAKAACFALACAGGAVAQTAATSEKTVEYKVVDQRIGDLLAMIERDTGLRIRASEAVRGRVQNRTLSGPVVAALTSLAAAHNLDVFEFGGTVHVSAREETALRLVRLNSVTKDRAMAALDEAGLRFDPNDVREAASGTALSLTGPPRMLAIAEAIVESIPPTARVASSNIRVRRGVSVELEPVNGAAPVSQKADIKGAPETQADNG